MIKKIAFLFLIYDIINHENLWYNFFRDINKNAYGIYIHYKYDKKLKYFEKYKIKNCIPTKWGDISLVKAQNVLLREALRDNNNKIFIFCSNSCIPLKNFYQVYKFLDEKYSYFNLFPDCHIFPRCNDTLKYIDKDVIKKASQWCILNRKHAELLTKEYNENLYIKWFNHTIGDEHCYITFINYASLTDEIITTFYSPNEATTFTNRYGMNYKYKSKACIKSYNDISISELRYLIFSPCLFGRKFTEKCNLNYLNSFINYSMNKSIRK